MTDASSLGWGRVLGEEKGGVYRATVQDQWDQWEQAWYINKQELEAVSWTLKHFQGDLNGLHVWVRTDNAKTCTYVNKIGETRSKAMCWQTWDLWRWCIHHQIHLSVENVLANFLSRQEVYQGEWSLHGKVMHQIYVRWGKPHIDMFASVHNHKVDRYCSLLANP